MQYLSKDWFVKLAQEYKPITVTYDTKMLDRMRAKLHEDYEGTTAYDSIRRGLRNCLRRAAVQLWINGERKKFHITKDLFDWQIVQLRKSLDYIDTFQDDETDRWGNNMLSQKMKDVKMIQSNKVIDIGGSRAQQGKLLSSDQVSMIKKIYKETSSVTETAKRCRCSRQTVYRILKS